MVLHTYTQQRFTADGRYALPDGVDAIDTFSSHFSSVATFISSELEYKQELDKFVQVSASVGIGFGLLFGAKYTKSSSYERSVEGLRTASTAFVDIEAVTHTYKSDAVPLLEAALDARLSADFQRATVECL